MGFGPEFQAAIERHYNLKIKKAIPGPRQCMAETFILDDAEGQQYFCKLIDKPLLIPHVLKSLPVINEMREKGIERISYPLSAGSGFHIFVGDVLVVLFNYIAASQSYDYNLYELGKLTAQTHKVSPKIEVSAPRESFEFAGRGLFDEWFEKGLRTKSLRDVLQKYESEIRLYYEEFLRLGDICRKKPRAFVLTHGDMPGNVLMKAPDDICVIDWDEIELAPAERDNWIIDHDPDYVEGYKSVCPEYKPDDELRSFCILKYYFRSFNYYFAEIFKDGISEQNRRDWINKLEEGLLAGWMQPKLDEVKRHKEKRMTKTKVPFQIRPFKETDLEAIQDIRHRAFAPVFESFRSLIGNEVFKRAMPDCDQEQAAYLKSICNEKAGLNLHVVLDNNNVVGFIAFSIDKKKKVGTIDLNAVDPDHQGKGVGKLMYDFVISKMKQQGVKVVTVSTGGDDSHAPARKAYEKAGFKASIPSVTMYRLL